MTVPVLLSQIDADSDEPRGSGTGSRACKARRVMSTPWLMEIGRQCELLYLDDIEAPNILTMVKRSSQPTDEVRLATFRGAPLNTLQSCRASRPELRHRPLSGRRSGHLTTGDALADGATVGDLEPSPAATSAAVTGPIAAENNRTVLGLQAADRPQTLSDRRAWKVAALFVIPYLMLMLSWGFSNPAGAAPDESDHLIKAIGMASFDIGTRYTGPGLKTGGLPARRNASISRVIPVPANLVPDGFSCTAFSPKRSAACLPTHFVTSTAVVHRVDPLGSYPPFLYLPMGLVATQASQPVAAFLVVRVFCLLVCAVLLLLGAAHLARVLGGRALLGAFVGLTPMAVFSASAVTTSGIEICAAFATACIVVASLRRPDSMNEAGTHWLLAGVGATLILSRQLGGVTFGLLMLLLLARLGPTFFWRIAKRRQLSFLGALAILLIAGVAVAVWERAYDNPFMVGSAFSPGSLSAFAGRGVGILRTGVAQFGWLDTSVPGWFIAAWTSLCVVMLAAAAVAARRADRWTLIVWLLLVLAVGFFTYATVFFPIHSGLQGRHLLAVFALLPLLAGVVIAERMERWNIAANRIIFGGVGIVMAALQFLALYINARRYAVGTDGPLWFLPVSTWQPPLGYTPWLVLGLLAAALIYQSTRSLATADGPYEARIEQAHVER